MTTDTLYDEDFVRWTERQAEALRRAAHAHGPRRLHIVIAAASSGATGAAQPA